MTSPRSRRIAYWSTTTATALLFAVPGAALVARIPHFVDEMSRLQYPAYFLSLLGVAKLLGAAVILLPRLPRLKEWAYAGLLFDAVGAVVSRTAIGDEPVKLLLPILIGVLALLSWQLRPESRRLALA
jgi:uncharacterized membrane protein YphA (DoxX/SURF4 family)